jgi:outer membrane protein
LPSPTLVLQYHILPDAKIDPYIDAGVNYTYFYNSNSGPVATKIDYQSSWGPALDVGADIALHNNWSVNLDVKKVWIDSHVKVTAPGVPTLKTKVKINPWIFGVGIGYRFS